MTVDQGKQDKFAQVMREFEGGRLTSSTGELVTSREQAKAIAASEAGLSSDEAEEMKNGLS